MEFVLKVCVWSTLQREEYCEVNGLPWKLEHPKFPFIKAVKSLLYSEIFKAHYQHLKSFNNCLEFFQLCMTLTLILKSYFDTMFKYIFNSVLHKPFFIIGFWMFQLIFPLTSFFKFSRVFEHCHYYLMDTKLKITTELIAVTY